VKSRILRELARLPRSQQQSRFYGKRPLAPGIGGAASSDADGCRGALVNEFNPNMINSR
jgi:hypothetical protein